MTDPFDALKSFQQALADREIAPKKGEIHDDLLVLLDRPNGWTRLSYALLRGQHVVGLAVFVEADPINGSPCFNAGYAVDEAARSQGFGKEVVQKAFDELTNGFRRAGIPHLYVEAIVSVSNDHSKRLAERLFSDSPTACTDSVSGEPALQYIKQLY